MDGPDGWCRYWRDFRKDEKHLCRTHTGAGGVIVWAEFQTSGTHLLFLKNGSG